jgi:hemoglobin/transferrin/lactoferrin receptor protein
MYVSRIHARQAGAVARMLCVAALAWGTGPAAFAQAGGPLVLDPIEVDAPRADEGFEPDPTSSSTRISGEELRRRQASNVFEAVEDVPGVSVSGGPLANGMRFNVRGYGDNEDVLVKIDGAIKDFEKYRFGGVFVEPELLKSIEVVKGPAVLTHGSGALGGAVILETKDARDVLRPGARLGGRLKVGHDFNNDEELRSLTAAAAPVPWLDAMANVTTRGSNDIRLPDGSRLDNTETDRDTRLLKLEAYPGEALMLGITRNDYASESLEPFDAETAVGLGPADYVRREVDDRTLTLHLELVTGSPWLDLRASLAHSDTRVADAGIDPAGIVPLGTTNEFDYDIWTLDLANSSYFPLGPTEHALTLGVQWNRNARTSVQVDESGSREYTAQPPGTKEYRSVILQETMTWADLTLGLGLRRDWYDITAEGSVAETLRGEGRPTRIELAETSPSASLAWTPGAGPVTVFGNYARAFRPPSIDEYFSAFTRFCDPDTLFLPFYAGLESRVPPSAVTALIDQLSPFLGEEQATALALGPSPFGGDPIFPGYRPVMAVYNEDLGYPSGLCGAQFRPEVAHNREVGVTYVHDDFLGSRGRLTAKLIYYTADVKNVLETIQALDSDTIGQPGREDRSGYELEVGFSAPRWYARLGVAVNRGHLECPGQRAELITPADSASLTLGRKAFGDRLDFGMRVRRVASRTALAPQSEFLGVNPCVDDVATTEQDGYTLHDLYATWRPNADTDVRVAVDNLANTEYETANGASVGTQGPGRSIRLSVAYRF